MIKYIVYTDLNIIYREESVNFDKFRDIRKQGFLILAVIF